MKKVLIVDDSGFMRLMLSNIIKNMPGFTVVGTAANGQEAVLKAKELRPDIITMDVTMPVMDGLAATEIIMKECPTKILMVSALTDEGTEATIKALSLGAVDFIVKSKVAANQPDLFKNKILEIADAKLNKTSITNNLTQKRVENRRELSKPVDVVLIGSSTGGPIALEKVLESLNISLPVVIVQHMPGSFTRALAKRLNTISQMEVKELEDGEYLRSGKCYVAPGGVHLLFKKEGAFTKAVLSDRNPYTFNTPHRPSVDVTACSLNELYDGRILAVILTGMGDDGARGFEQIKNRGGTIIAQDEKSCTIYGMPKAVIERNLADYIISLNEIGMTINKLVKK